ncbi:MAG: WYL domain-containing protein [Geodermatophilaceae bacterium]|nr:WYL domain-containing protein [Geodermatophilaceae bacterium]MDQ3455606.1 WYL domain-containing protein [Actinomycetota bacterium]
MLSSSARLLQLLGLLQQRQLWSAYDLADRLGITERTVRRDVERLRLLGYPVYAAPGSGGGYRLGAGAELPPLLLDDDEAVAVAVGLRAAGLGAIEGLGEASARALGKLEQVLPARLVHLVTTLQAATVPLAAAAATVDTELLIGLAAACRDSVRLRFDYRPRDGEPAYRRVEPHRLVNAGNRWYLVARDEDRDDWRTFRVDRIVSSLTRGGGFVAVDPPDAAALVAAGTTIAPYRYQARLRLHVSLAEAAALIPPTAGVLSSEGPVSTLLDIGSNSLDAMAMHIGLLDCRVDVLAPPELRAHLALVAERISQAARP